MGVEPKVSYRLANPRGTDLLKEYRLASLYCFSNYFVSEHEDVQLLQDDLQAFLGAIRKSEFPLELIERLDRDGMLPFLFYALENQELFESRNVSDAYIRTLVCLSAMQLREVFLPEVYDPMAFFGRTGIYTRIFRCVLFYCTKIKQSLMSGKSYYGTRLEHVSTVLLPILQEVEEDVYILSEFIAHDSERHHGAGRDYDAYFSNEDYARLKDVYLDRIAKFQKTGKLVPHPEFFDLFRTWTILLAREGKEERMKEFRDACLILLRDPVAIPKMLVFFVQDNRASGSLSDQLEVCIDLERLHKFFGDGSSQVLLKTLESMTRLSLYVFHALISLRYVVKERADGRTCDREKQKAHLLEWGKTEEYRNERNQKVGV